MNQVAVKEKGEINPISDFRNNLSKMDNEFRAALPEHVTVDKFKRVVMTAVQSNDDLLKADQVSLFKSCVQCASDGLLPDGKEAALVIFNTNKRTKDQNGRWVDNWVKSVQYMPMIKGLIKLARNSGEVSNFTAQVVYENDKFTFDLASEERPKHEIDLTKPRGKLLAAYAIANFKDGSFQLEIMTREEIERIRDCSKGIKTDEKTGKQSGIWISWESEMWRKTVAKRLMKYLSLSPEIQRAIEADNAFYDLEKLSAPQAQLALPKTLDSTWKEEPKPEPDVLENKDADQDLILADLRVAIDDAIFFDDIADVLNQFIEYEIWQYSKPEFQAYILKEIVAPKVEELNVNLDLGKLDIAGFLAMLWTLDTETLGKYLKGEFTEGHKDLRNELKPLIELRQKELANG